MLRSKGIYKSLAAGLLLAASSIASSKALLMQSGIIGSTYEYVWFNPLIVGYDVSGVVHFDLKFNKPVTDFEGFITFYGYYDIMTCPTMKPSYASCGGADPGGGDDHYIYWEPTDNTNKHFSINQRVETTYDFLYPNQEKYVFEVNPFIPYEGYFAGSSSDGSSRYTLTGYLTGVPEPATWALMLFGIGAVGARMRRRQPQLAMRTA